MKRAFLACYICKEKLSETCTNSFMDTSVNKSQNLSKTLPDFFQFLNNSLTLKLEKLKIKTAFYNKVKLFAVIP